MNDAEVSHSIALLAALEPGKLPLGIFNEVSRLTVTPVVEVVPFYKDSDGSLKVVLFQRAADDKLWSGMYHIPGTIVLATDTFGSFDDAIKRVLDGKLLNCWLTTPIFVESQLCQVQRGMEVALIYMTQLGSMPENGQLFNVRGLPSNMVEGQADFVQVAFNKFNSG